MQEINLHNITIDKLTLPAANSRSVMVEMLRLDRIHSLISGNKWFKLRYYLEEARDLERSTIITYGGAWSNHILATAAACKLEKLNCVGIIRGEKPSVLSPILQQAIALGMQPVFISRGDYAKENLPQELKSKDNYVIPQGGYGIKGMKGASEILGFLKKENYSDICCAVGTGTMVAGLFHASLSSHRVTGISVLKNNKQLERDIAKLTGVSDRYFIDHSHHFGGYAKYNQVLIDFMNQFYNENRIPLDFVYTGKLVYAVNALLEQEHFKPGSRILLIHSGGLAGNSSLKKGTLIF